jgi:DNA-binding YbaB/EbfC family protein
MNNFDQLMKQARQMQEKLTEVGNKMSAVTVTGSSGGGLVTVVIDGKANLKKLHIDPKLMSPDETDILSDLIVAAFNDAKSKLEAEVSEKMSGLLPPGMKMPF